jgi:hypothetical protein
MLLLKLSDAQGETFDESPEAGMGLQFARVGDELGFVLSGRALFLAKPKRRESQKRSDALADQLWFGPDIHRRGRETIAPRSVEADVSRQ